MLYFAINRQCTLVPDLDRTFAVFQLGYSSGLRSRHRKCCKLGASLPLCIDCGSSPNKTLGSQNLIQERDEWAARVRNATGRHAHRLWQPCLNPPPLLSHVAVVLIGPKHPSSVGAVARALNCFECEDLRIVRPQCDHLARSARSGSKGAQYLLWRTQVHSDLEAALEGTSASIAFTRWVDDSRGRGQMAAFRSVSELMHSPEMADRVTNSGGRGGNIALVFGREVSGLTVEEVDLCTATCSIPMGRLQESLSLSHAVTLALSPLFETRQAELRRKEDQNLEVVTRGN